jgi:hypothetical protein
VSVDPIRHGQAGGVPAQPDEGGFLSRWSRRKALVRQGAAVPEPVPAVALPAGVLTLPAPPQAEPAALPAEPRSPIDGAKLPPPVPPPAPPQPTLADVAALTRESDYARFVAPGVDSGVKNAALKKLFTDPHFNIMDGLDTYIDDYGRPDPLPPGMLRQMVQSQFLGLFADEDAAASDLPPDAVLAADDAPDPLPEPAAPPALTPHEDADLRLQPHDAAGPPGTGPGADPDPGRQR